MHRLREIAKEVYYFERRGLFRWLEDQKHPSAVIVFADGIYRRLSDEELDSKVRECGGDPTEIRRRFAYEQIEKSHE
jgi:hypothetical protein